MVRSTALAGFRSIIATNPAAVATDAVARALGIVMFEVSRRTIASALF